MSEIKVTEVKAKRKLFEALKKENLLAREGKIFEKRKLHSTGLLGLDLATGGGYAEGSVVEVYGETKTGKTHLALAAVAAMQKKGEFCVYIDAERRLSEARMMQLGVEVDDLIVINPETEEIAFDAMERYLQSAAIRLIVVDSLAVMLPENSLNYSLGKGSIDEERERVISEALSRLNPLIVESGTIVMFITHVRNNNGLKQGTTTAVGDDALRYYASMQLELIADNLIISSKGETLGHKTNIFVRKNSTGTNDGQATLKIYPAGLSHDRELMELGVKHRVITRNGDWFMFGEVCLGVTMVEVAEYLNNTEDKKHHREKIEGEIRRNGRLTLKSV